MTKDDIELQAAKFYDKIDLDQYNLTPEQRADAEAMAKDLSFMAARFLCRLKIKYEAPGGIDQQDWNDLDSLLQIGKGILSESEQASFIEYAKKIIATHKPQGAEFYLLLDLQSRIRSHFSRAGHQANIDAFELVDGFVPDEITLSEEEYHLLYKINKQPFPGTYLPGYFTYQYGLDLSYSLNKLIYLGYLAFVPQSQYMSKLTCAQLRDLLDRYGLPTKGKKDELIDRVYNNIHPDEIDTMYPTGYFVATDKWKDGDIRARLQG